MSWFLFPLNVCKNGNVANQLCKESIKLCFCWSNRTNKIDFDSNFELWLDNEMQVSKHVAVTDAVRAAAFQSTLLNSLWLTFFSLSLTFTPPCLLIPVWIYDLVDHALNLIGQHFTLYDGECLFSTESASVLHLVWILLWTTLHNTLNTGHYSFPPSSHLLLHFIICSPSYLKNSIFLVPPSPSHPFITTQLRWSVESIQFT